MAYPEKLVILVPLSVPMTAGKLASQVAHAAEGACVKASHTDPERYARYVNLGMRVKYVLSVKGEAELYAKMAEAAKRGLQVTPFMDGGSTTEGTGGVITAVAIGPDAAARIDPVTGKLPLYGYEPPAKRGRGRPKKRTNKKSA